MILAFQVTLLAISPSAAQLDQYFEFPNLTRKWFNFVVPRVSNFVKNFRVTLNYSI